MRVKEVAADGNCFFRAMCDQRWGSSTTTRRCADTRWRYMKSNRDDFEPFIEDDEKWDAYIERMSEDGTWAGNMELQAASLVCMANVCVHQAGQPRWEIVNFPADRWFHVTYEGSEHYNSARLISDDDDAPGGPITLARSNGAYATRGDVGGREPSAAAVAATVAEAGARASASERDPQTLRRMRPIRRRRGPRGDVLPRRPQRRRGGRPRARRRAGGRRRARRGSNLRPTRGTRAARATTRMTRRKTIGNRW